MPIELVRKWMILVLESVVLFTGCATATPFVGHDVRLDRKLLAGPGLVGEGLLRRRSERSRGLDVATARPAEQRALHTVDSGAVTSQADAFADLLLLAGLDNVNDEFPRGTSLSPRKAAQILTVLLNKPVTLGSFPPRMAVRHLLVEVMDGGEVSHDDLLRRVDQFKTVAVLRPDGCLAWTLNGRTQQRVGPVEWRDEAFHAGPFVLGRFYTVNGWVFRQADAQLGPILDGPGLAEVYDDADYIGRSLDGAEEAFVGLYHAMGQLLTRPMDSLAALQHLPAGVADLITSSPEYLERFRYMTRGEQVREVSKLTTHLILAFGTAGGTASTLTRALGEFGSTVPVLTLSADGLLGMSAVVVSPGTVTTTLGVGVGAVSILHMASQGQGTTGPAPSRPSRTPTRTDPRLEEGNPQEGWQHIEARHITGTHTHGPGDLFAPGTSRAQLLDAAKDIVKNGNRISEPIRRIQVFQMKVKINGLKDLVRVIVDSDDANRIITMFPVRSE